MTQPTDRESARRAFAVSYIGEAATLTPLGGDASYRSYYRCQTNGASYILMDAPVATARRVSCCWTTSAIAGSGKTCGKTLLQPCRRR